MVNEELIQKTPPVDIKSEVRSFKRFGERGDVLLKFFPFIVRGELINISMGGLLTLFHRNTPLPSISDNVVAGLEIDGKGRIFEVSGTVIRIQEPRTLAGPEYVEIAIKFINLAPEKKHEIRKIVDFLMRKTGGYSYFRSR